MTCRPPTQPALSVTVMVFLAATAPWVFAQAPATAVPVPREGRWMDLHQSFVARAAEGNVDLLFLGDSITQGWHPEVWNRFYAPRRAANFGIGGDRTEHVLWRIQHGELEGIRPRVVVLMIGTNNAGSNSADEIVAGITAIVQELRGRLPEAKVLLLGVFPRSPSPDAVRQRLEEVNRRIASLADGSSVVFLDLKDAFLNADGTISREIMPDFLHLSRRGYRIWAEAMEPTLWKLLDEPRD